MNPLSQLLADHDRWTGAACVGQWETFDPRHDNETADEHQARVYRAQTVCGSCPIFDNCRNFAGNARPRDRVGTWAGIAYDHNGRPIRLKEFK